MLGAVAAPMVLSQGHNAQDARAQALVARLAGHIEACRVSASSYRDCDERSEVGDDPVDWGDRAGQAGVIADRSEDQAFTAYAVSGSGTRLYVWASRDNHVVRSVCPHGSVARLKRDDCARSGW